MEKVIDTIKDGEAAMEYWDRCRFGFIGTVEDILKDLNDINEATNEVNTQIEVERVIRKLEAQLNK
jgi:hypothetical protein